MNLIDNDGVNYIDLNLQKNKAFEEMLIDFQNFLKDKKLIEGDDDSFKKIARQFIKCRKVMYKKNAKHKTTVVNHSECDHDYRHGFNLIEGSFTRMVHV